MADRSARLVIRRVVDGVLWLLVAGASAVFATQLIGTPSRTIAALQALTPWAVPPLLVVVIVAWRSERPAQGYAASVVAAAYLALMMPLAFHAGQPAADPEAEPFVVMTSNLLYSNADIAHIGAAIEAAAPDVIAFSEVTSDLADGLLAHAVAEGYPHRIVAPAGAASGMMMWSRYPLADTGQVDAAWRSIDSIVTTPSGDVRVVAMHPPPPVFDHTAWRRDLDRLDDIVETSSLPTVVAGDLNASYFHPVFRRSVAAAGLTDAARATGDGDHFTWPTDEMLPPFVAIDHVLVDRNLVALDTTVMRIRGSDHAAVVATLVRAAEPDSSVSP